MVCLASCNLRIQALLDVLLHQVSVFQCPKGYNLKMPTWCNKVILLTLVLLKWIIWWAPNNANKWQVVFNSAFKGLMYSYLDMFQVHTPIIRSIRRWVAAYGFLHRVFWMSGGLESRRYHHSSKKLGAENHMLQLNVWCSWWWAYVPETCRAKNILI